MLKGTRSVFRNRWFALAWAAGICLLAVQFIGADPTPAASNAAAADGDQPTDATGAPIDNQQMSDLKNAIDSIN